MDIRLVVCLDNEDACSGGYGPWRSVKILPWGWKQPNDLPTLIPATLATLPTFANADEDVVAKGRADPPLVCKMQERYKLT